MLLCSNHSKVTSMEQPRESQVQGGPAPYPYPYPPAPTPAPAYQQPAALPAKRPSIFAVIGTFLRLLLRKFIYALVWVLRPLRNHVFPSIITITLLGVIAWMGFQLWAPRLAEPADPRVALIPPAPAVQNYLTGRRTFDATLMWEAFNSDYQAEQIQQGASKATLEALLRQEQRLGLQYRNLQYIGGTKRDEGGHFYYYSVDVALQSTSGRFPIIFAADKDEKIEYIITPLDDVIRNLLQR
jgi:hypothetical protein